MRKLRLREIEKLEPKSGMYSRARASLHVLWGAALLGCCIWGSGGSDLSSPAFSHGYQT